MAAGAGSSTETKKRTTRDRLTDVVQWEPARESLRQGAWMVARTRAQVLERRGALPDVVNVYAASCPKNGSQWIKALLHHPIVRAHTGLFTLPQRGYHVMDVVEFPTATFVPGLYVSHDYYQRMRKPDNHRLVYVFRDPRDIAVSAYFSGLETHREIADVAQSRAYLRSSSVDEGMMFLIKKGEDHYRDMATWVGVRDDHVRSWRLEDIAADEPVAIREILEHCGVSLSESEMATVIAQCSRSALQSKDLASRTAGSESHYRVQREGYAELLKPEHYAEIERIIPGFIEQMGYPPSPWP
jgi:hypothetical protein